MKKLVETTSRPGPDSQEDTDANFGVTKTTGWGQLLKPFSYTPFLPKT